MKNKGFLLSLFIAGSLTANAQDIKEWLSLTPIKMEKPALSHVKNVKDQVFTDAMLTDYSGVNIGSLVPMPIQRRIIFTGSGGRWPR